MDINAIASKQDLTELWDKIVLMFNEKFAQLSGTETTAKQQQWLRSREVRKLLNISDNKLRDMRNNREIPFSLVGKTYYYSGTAIQQVMDNNTRKPNP